MSDSPNNIDTSNISVYALKEWLKVTISVAACVAGVIFWVQSSSDVKFEHVQTQIESLKDDMEHIEQDNDKILRVIGRLEGRLGNRRHNRPDND